MSDNLNPKALKAAVDAVFLSADGDAKQIAKAVVKAYLDALAETPSPEPTTSGLHGINKEWFERRAKAEGDLEIGAGFSVVNPTDADMAQMEVVAEQALPRWAQIELARLRVVALDMQKGYIAARGLVERATAIISTSTYPNWHEAARAAPSPEPRERGNADG